jgi:hypothetical protein
MLSFVMEAVSPGINFTRGREISEVFRHQESHTLPRVMLNHNKQEHRGGQDKKVAAVGRIRGTEKHNLQHRFTGPGFDLFQFGSQ